MWDSLCRPGWPHSPVPPCWAEHVTVTFNLPGLEAPSPHFPLLLTESPVTPTLEGRA